MTRLAHVPSVFHGIEPGALAVSSTLASLAKDYGAAAGYDPPLTATHPTALRTKGNVCILLRDHGGRVMQSKEWERLLAKAQHPADSDEPGAVLAPLAEQQKTIAEL